MGRVEAAGRQYEHRAVAQPLQGAGVAVDDGGVGFPIPLDSTAPATLSAGRLPC